MPETTVTPPLAIIPQALPITTTKEQPDFAGAPKNLLTIKPVKHPLRFSIQGKKHLISNLKEMIAADAIIPDHYKAALAAELEKIKTNAAEVDLHVVDHADGGISFAGHVKPISLG